MVVDDLAVLDTKCSTGKHGIAPAINAGGNSWRCKHGHTWSAHPSVVEQIPVCPICVRVEKGLPAVFPHLVAATAAHLPFPNDFFHCLVSSPPYYQMRRYNCVTSFPAVTYRSMVGGPVIEVPKWEGELGWEPVPEWFIGHLVYICREVYRTLRLDGTFWLNIGDAFWTEGRIRQAMQVRSLVPGEEKGQLMGIPYRLMFALQADGWFLRNDVQWVKRNPRPEGQLRGTQWDVTTDGSFSLHRGNWRHTRAHELIMQLHKSENYFSDQTEARQEPAGYRRKGGSAPPKSARNGTTNDGIGSSSLHQMNLSGANPRSYIESVGEYYGGDHAAPFPASVIRCLIQASTPRYVCPCCQEPWPPVVVRRQHLDGAIEYETVGYRPVCACYEHLQDHEKARDFDWRSFVADVEPHLIPEPGIVGDVFCGAGTVPLVALSEGYRCFASDLSQRYLSDDAYPRLIESLGRSFSKKEKLRSKEVKVEDLPLFRFSVVAQ